jgi:hypothetical protein
MTCKRERTRSERQISVAANLSQRGYEAKKQISAAASTSRGGNKSQMWSEKTLLCRSLPSEKEKELTGVELKESVNTDTTATTSDY